MKTLLQEVNYKEVEVDLPLYSYIKEEDKEIFTKIDEKHIRQITIKESSIEFSKQKTTIIAEIYYKNKSYEIEWNAIEEIAKKFINNYF